MPRRALPRGHRADRLDGKGTNACRFFPVGKWHTSVQVAPSFAASCTCFFFATPAWQEEVTHEAEVSIGKSFPCAKEEGRSANEKNHNAANSEKGYVIRLSFINSPYAQFIRSYP
jgi:hypothetical protein